MAAILAFPTVLLTLHYWARRDAVYAHGRAIAEKSNGTRNDFVEPALGKSDGRHQLAEFWFTTQRIQQWIHY